MAVIECPKCKSKKAYYFDRAGGIRYIACPVCGEKTMFDDGGNPLESNAEIVELRLTKLYKEILDVVNEATEFHAALISGKVSLSKHQMMSYIVDKIITPHAQSINNLYKEVQDG